MRVIVAILLGLVLVAAGFLWVNRPQRVLIDAELPADFPAVGFSHSSFETLLERYVDADGYVDYAAWHAAAADRALLDSYLAAIAAYSPENAPDRFSNRNDELAYWLYAYNAAVIHGVLRNWPVESVMQVRAPVEAVRGMGFFYVTRYEFGGRFMSLYTVENGIVRKQYRDPRIHFVLNCASESCPVVRPELPSGDALEDLLREATRDFVSDPRNVAIDHDARTITFSDIFRMYRGDFENHLRAGGQPTGSLVAYVTSVAPATLADDLERARDYEVRFFDFDWQVNDVDR